MSAPSDRGPEPIPPALKPCPFCGKNIAATWVNDHDAWEVECDTTSQGADGCGARTGDYQTEEDAVAAWNNRTTPADA